MMLERLRNGVSPNLILEVARFGVIGVMATLCHFIVLNLLAAPLGSVAANCVAFLCAVNVTYFGQSIWVFKRRSIQGAQMRRFAVSAISGLILNAVLMAAFTGLFAWHYNQAFILIVFLVPAILFLINKFWVFAEAPHDEHAFHN